MKRLLILLCLFSLVLFSCSKEKGEVMIRVVNQTGKQITDIRVISFTRGGADVEKTYGSVSPGSATGYRAHERAWNIPLLRFTLADREIDATTGRCGVGLGDLSSGNYSIIIRDDLAINLRED